MYLNRRILVAFTLVAVANACGGGRPTGDTDGPLRVVATTTIGPLLLVLAATLALGR